MNVYGVLKNALDFFIIGVDEEIRTLVVAAVDNNHNNAGLFILHRLLPDDIERVITTLWTEAHYT